MGKKTDYALLKAGFGLARGLSDEFIQACERVNPPIEVIHRLVTPNGHATMDAMVRRAVADWEAEQPQPVIQNGHPYRGGVLVGDLPSGFYRAFVNYAPLPSRAELGKEFAGEDSVSMIFDGRSFTNHASCKDVDETPGEKMFWLAAPPDEVLDDSEKIISWAATQEVVSPCKRIRPATHKEARAFAKAHPELQKENPIVALGAFALFGDVLCVAVLRFDGGGRIFVGCWFGSRWNRHGRFLFVCEAS